MNSVFLLLLSAALSAMLSCGFVYNVVCLGSGFIYLHPNLWFSNIFVSCVWSLVVWEVSFPHLSSLLMSVVFSLTIPHRILENMMYRMIYG